MPSIRSSAITFAEYDEFKRELVLTFIKGNSYTYYGVPPELYAEFMSSSSKGTFFNDYIRDKFSGR